jgi:hypothetical protein
MSDRWRSFFAGSVVASVAVCLLLPGRPAFAAGTNLSEASPASAAMATILGQAEQTCDDVDDSTGQEACQEATETAEESQPAEDTCEELDDQTEQETCDEVESTSGQAGQQDETGLSVNNNQTTNNPTNSEPTNGDPNANDQGQTDQPAESRNEGTQSAKKSNTESKTDGSLARLGRWVVQVTDRVGDFIGGVVGRVGHFIGGVVGRVSDLVGGEDGASGTSNPTDNSQAAAGNDQSGESSATNARGSEVGDPPPPWWEAWLPFTGSRSLVLAVIVALVLIASGVALRSVRRQRRFPGSLPR